MTLTAIAAVTPEDDDDDAEARALLAELRAPLREALQRMLAEPDF